MSFFSKSKLAFAIVAMLLATILVVQNTDEVDTKVLIFTITMSRALVYALMFAAGVVVGLVLAYVLTGKKSASE